ncbi:hypothetical protein JCM11754A_30530 [Isoptericola variabilis]
MRQEARPGAREPGDRRTVAVEVVLERLPRGRHGGGQARVHGRGPERSSRSTTGPAGRGARPRTQGEVCSGAPGGPDGEVDMVLREVIVGLRYRSCGANLEVTAVRRQVWLKICSGFRLRLP